MNSMSELDEFYKEQNQISAPTTPKEGQPSVSWDGRAGFLTTGPLEKEPKSWDDLIRDWGLDPAEVKVRDGSVQIRAWDANVGGGQIERLRYYRAELEPRIAPDVAIDKADFDKLIRQLSKRKTVKPKKAKTDGATRVICIGDPQIGKDGTSQRLPLILDSIEAAIANANGCSRIVLLNMGDTTEGCVGNYPNQQFTVELDHREQQRVARRMWVQAVDMAAQVAPVDVLAVPSNHGERRHEGKAFTRTSDNDDLAILDQVQYVIQESGRYPDVRFGFPPDDDPLVICFEAGNVIVAACHGHKLGSGTTPEQRAHKWWQGQALGNRPAGQAEILITAHYHHYAMTEMSGRTWIQTPALDAGSQWWTDRTGQSSPSGLLSFAVGQGIGAGGRHWTDLTLT